MRQEGRRARMEAGYGCQGMLDSKRLNFPLARAQKGFTLIELIVVITIVVLLTTVFLDRMWYYQERAEKTAMVEVAGTIQSALLMQFGRMVVRGQEAAIGTLASENPMRWLAKMPANYAGEFFDPQPGVVPSGNWAFDLGSHELIYIPERTDFFVPDKDGKKWVRYRVRLLYDPLIAGPDSAGKVLAGALFEPKEPYRWFE